MRFLNKVVLISGGSSGIGAACVKLFCSEGAFVYFLYNKNDKGAKEVVDYAKKNGGNAEAIKFDIANIDGIDDVVAHIIKNHAKIDVLVNSAGVVFDRNFDDIKIEEVERVFKVNTFAPLFICKKVSKFMPMDGKSAIVNVSSNGGIFDHSPDVVDYKMSKAAMIQLSKNLAVQFKGKIRVNDIAPGWVDTPFNATIPEDLWKHAFDRYVLKRQADPIEIAKIVVFLASEDASFMNGAVVLADGGAL